MLINKRQYNPYNIGGVGGGSSLSYHVSYAELEYWGMDWYIHMLRPMTEWEDFCTNLGQLPGMHKNKKESWGDFFFLMYEEGTKLIAWCHFWASLAILSRNHQKHYGFRQFLEKHSAMSRFFWNNMSSLTVIPCSCPPISCWQVVHSVNFI